MILKNDLPHSDQFNKNPEKELNEPRLVAKNLNNEFGSLSSISEDHKNEFIPSIKDNTNLECETQ
jgi:hypothetical protein